jgi:hypothetical protein
VLNPEKRNTEDPKNHREIRLSLSAVYSASSRLSPRCSLWFISVFSVLNSDKRDAQYVCCAIISTASSVGVYGAEWGQAVAVPSDAGKLGTGKRVRDLPLAKTKLA